MKKLQRPVWLLSFSILAISFASCKGKNANTTATDTATIVPAPMDNTTKAVDTAIVINPDDSLKSMSMDAVKDFPGVTAMVDQGVITLTGNITRDKLPKLMMAVNALHPKKVQNNLTISK